MAPTKSARSLLGSVRRYLPETREESRRLATFLAAVVVLDVLVNLRFPAPELHFWYLLPALDVVLLLGAFVLCGVQGVRVPKGVHVALAAYVVLVRVLRFGDGVVHRYYSQKFTLYDLALVPEGVRFAHSALPAWKFYALLFAAVLALALLPVVAYRALRAAADYLSDWRRAPLVAVLAVVAFVVGSALPRKPHHQPLFTGGFGTSSVPRVRREARELVEFFASREHWLAAIERAERELAHTPSNLEKLAHRDVHLILVESYGEVALERPDFASALAPTFRALESELGARGFSIASGRLRSTTSGGRSWLAHAALATTVPTDDQRGFDVVLERKPKTLAAFFREAGYRTVLAAPGVTRVGKRGDLYRFDKNYYYKDFEYAGPAFGWATLPDQYVFDFVRRRELRGAAQPRFVQYVLVSSHAPWNETPTLVEDWSKIRNGAMFDQHPVLRFPIVWPNLDHAHEAYIRSIIYDFEVIRRYVAEFVARDALVIVLGDHPPVVEITGDESARTVPVHVLGGDPDLVEPFRARGYVPGMWTRGSAAARGIETFLTDLLRDFSTRR